MELTMRGAWVLAVMAFAALIARAEDLDGPFSASKTVEHDCVSIFLGVNDRAWLNGERIAVRGGDRILVTIRPGDTFVYAVGRNYWDKQPIPKRTFRFYHLDAVDGSVARFTESTYSVRTEPYEREGVRVFPDRLMSRCTMQVTSEPVVDGGWGEMPGVEVKSSLETTRLK